MREPIIDFGFSLNTPDPQTPIRKFWDAVLLTVLGAGLGFGLSWVGFSQFLQMPLIGAFLKGVLEQKLALNLPTFAGLGSLLIAGVLGVFGWVEGFKARERLTHIRGRRFLTGGTAVESAQKILKEEISASGEGVSLSADLKFSAQRETLHTIVVGGVGAGKTTIAHHLLKEIFQRNDKAIIVDWKGDFTAGYKGLILNPLDKRSKRWAVALDVVNELDAGAFAYQIIPEQKDGDAYFTNAGRAILTGLVIKLQKTKPKCWTWADLYNEACQGYDGIRAAIEKYYPQALSNIEEQGKQSQGVISQISAQLEVVRVLAQAEEDNPQVGAISAGDWLEKNLKHNQLILGGVTNYAHIGRGYMSAFITCLANKLQSLEDSNTRRVWLIADEFPLLGKCDSIIKLIAFGRSKGARVVLLAQDISQIRATYGADTAKALPSMVGTLIIGRTQGGETADTIARQWIGTREVERRNITNQGNGAKSSSWQRDELLVVHPSELQTALGPQKKKSLKGKETTTHINALVLGLGEYALNLPFTFVNPAKIRAPLELRECFGGAKVERKTQVIEQVQNYALNPQKEEEKGEANEVNNEATAHAFEAALDSLSASLISGLSIVENLSLQTRQPTAAPAHAAQVMKAHELEEEREG